MRAFSFYHKDTGALNRQTLRTDEGGSSDSSCYAGSGSKRLQALLELNTPADHVAIEGVADPLSQRFDIASAKLVDWQPPQPTADHEWNATTKRWQLSQTVVAKRAARKSALAAIAALELSQARPIRELMLDSSNQEARANLAEIDQQVGAARARLLA